MKSVPEPDGPASGSLSDHPGLAPFWPSRCSALWTCPCTSLLHFSHPKTRQTAVIYLLLLFESQERFTSCHHYSRSHPLCWPEFVPQRRDLLLQTLNLRLFHSQGNLKHQHRVNLRSLGVKLKNFLHFERAESGNYIWLGWRDKTNLYLHYMDIFMFIKTKWTCSGGESFTTGTGQNIILLYYNIYVRNLKIFSPNVGSYWSYYCNNRQ